MYANNLVVCIFCVNFVSVNFVKYYKVNYPHLNEGEFSLNILNLLKNK